MSQIYHQYFDNTLNVMDVATSIQHLAPFVFRGYCQGMNAFNEYKTGHIAAWLNQHDNTIRDWSRRYKPYLSAGANAGRRRYNDSDVRVLATVAKYRNEGLAIDTIDTLLADGKLIPLEDIPQEPTPETEAARDSVDILAIPRDTYLLEVERYQLQINTYQDRIEYLESALTDAAGDKERIQGELTKAREELGELRGKLGVMEVERRPASYWLAVIAGIVVIVVIMAAVIVVYLGSRG